MRFSKWHALGNSYLLVERSESGRPLDSETARRLCDVRYGIGSDGVLEVVAARGRTGRDRDLEPRRLRRGVLRQRQPHRRRVARPARRRGSGDDRGRPGARTPRPFAMTGRSRWASVTWRWGRSRPSSSTDERVELTAVSVGNPHAVVRGNPMREELLRLGPQLEMNERFPDRTNVQLVGVDGEQRADGARLGARSGGDERVGLERRRGRGRCGHERLVREPGDGPACPAGSCASSWTRRTGSRSSAPPRRSATATCEALRPTAGPRARTLAARRSGSGLLVVRLLAPADDQRAGELVRPGRELLRPRARDDDRARRDGAAVLDRLRARHVDDRHGRGQRDVRARAPRPAPMRTPSVTMQREPRNAPSSTITGRAFGGSSTPPMPTPPARCTSAPICAHEPTVAHVSTIVRGPTQAPMFT